jgi:hypothetical protein
MSHAKMESMLLEGGVGGHLSDTLVGIIRLFAKEDDKAVTDLGHGRSFVREPTNQSTDHST